ncbi:MAG: esterase family protein [Actinomycetota bacterium]|nr:esterase family protein [Actinomycetota bacterium]
MQPDSIFLVVVLFLLAGASVYATVRFASIVVKLLTGVLALVLAAVSGITMVNIYYGYYQTWSQLSGDLNNSYTQFDTPPPAGGKNTAVSTGHGRLQPVLLKGGSSGISRSGFVYLPPQYFQAKYAHTRFPVLELLHGSPGTPNNWVQQINITSIMDQLIEQHLVGPMVIVMPAMNAGNKYQECTNAPGALDDTYISQDVPTDVRAAFRVSNLPAEWGIGGYSSGGYCAANLALRHRLSYGAAGIMDGYFRPTDGPAAGALHFNKQLENSNNPLLAAQRLRPGATPLPAFWVSAGTVDAKYALGARAFVKALSGIEAVDFTSQPGQGHNYYAWRSAMPRMLVWMWPQIAPPSLRVNFPIAGPVTNKILLGPRAPHRKTPTHRPTSTPPHSGHTP